VYGPGGWPLEQITGSTVLWLHRDQLGSTRLVTDSVGASQATYTFDPFGNLAASTGTITNPFRFSGEYADSESGLYHLRTRYYDPATGQFLTRDPAVARTRSPHGYVKGNPLNERDPSGLDCVITDPEHWNDGGFLNNACGAVRNAAEDLKDQYDQCNQAWHDAELCKHAIEWGLFKGLSKLGDFGKGCAQIIRTVLRVEKVGDWIGRVAPTIGSALGELPSDISSPSDFARGWSLLVNQPGEFLSIWGGDIARGWAALF
jgi:RHS repeat-associated protein